MTQDRQILNASTQAISKLEVQMSQLANAIHEREKNKFPSQPEVNPKFPLNQRPHDNVNDVIYLRLGTQVYNHVGENSNGEEELTPTPNPSLGQTENPENSKFVSPPSEPSSSRIPCSIPENLSPTLQLVAQNPFRKNLVPKSSSLKLLTRKDFFLTSNRFKWKRF